MVNPIRSVALLSWVLVYGAGIAEARAQTAPAPTETVTANPTSAAKTSGVKAVPTSVTKTVVKTAAKPAGAPAGAGGTGGGAAAPAPTRPASAPSPAAAGGKEAALSTPPAGSSPLAVLKKSNDELDKLLKKKYPAWSPEGEAQKADVRRLVGGFLDYRELARRALAKHWDTLKPAQREEFVSTLRELVERSYLKQVRGDPNYNIKYQKEDKSGSEATVDATLTTMARGKKVSVTLVYKLVYKDRWLVYDLVTDEQSMLENYRAEFNKIINKDGFDVLLKRMKKKLEEKDE